MGFVVIAGYVTVETAVPGGRAEVDILRGADVPGDAPAEQVEHLLRLGWIEPVEADGPTQVEDEGEVPSGTIAEIAAWVDGDPDRAALALEAERSYGDKARSTLITALTAIVEQQ